MSQIEDPLTTLLNDSKEWEEESTTKDDKPWSEKFKLKKEEVKEMMKDMKEKTVERLMTARVRPSIPAKSLRSKELQVPESGGAEGAEARTNVIAVVVRKIQTVVRDHGYVLDLIKEMLLKLERRTDTVEKKVKLAEETSNTRANLVTTMSERVKDVEAKVNENNEKFTANEFKQQQFEEKLTKLKEDHSILAQQKEDMEKDIDETRQRGLKGNLILSSPDLPGHSSHLIQRNNPDGSRETELQMCVRLIGQKTTIYLKQEDVVACHRLGKDDRNKNSYILSVSQRNNNSEWDRLAQGMVTGRIGRREEGINFTRDNIYVNFQLTRKRAQLVQQCRLLVKQEPKPISKYSVNQNGQITVLKEGGSRRWEQVRDLEELTRISGVELPIVRGREQVQQRGR